MIYQEVLPAPDLESHLLCFWHFELEPSDPDTVLHTIPPDGAVNLAWIPDRRVLTVVGPRTDALRLPVNRGFRYFGARPRPGAAGPLLGLDVADLRHQNQPYAHLSPERGSELLEALAATEPRFDCVIDRMSQVFRQWNPEPPDAAVAQLVDRMVADAESDIRHLVTTTGLSYRQALRRFKHAVGLTPSEFLRLRRVRLACIHALESADSARWAEISASTGFADQSHLTREFSWAFQWTPKLVLAYLRRIKHSGVRP